MSPIFRHKFINKTRGVNLGSWLVLEKWMVPSLFNNLKAIDETSFCVELGKHAESLLRSHWNSFITESDFEWLASIGINAVRIPIGHWIFGCDYPYHKAYGNNRHPYVVGGIDILDNAFIWAEKYGLMITIDLHAAPGCQNGFDNGGIQDVCEWHTKTDYLLHSLNILENLAKRYHVSTALQAIEVLNEPRWDIDTGILKNYYTEAYMRIRQYCQPEQVAVVFHDGFRSFENYSGFMTEPSFKNVIIDIHRYQCFDQKDIELNIYEHIKKSIEEWQKEADAIFENRGHQAWVGEWSLGLDLHPVPLWTRNAQDNVTKQDKFQITTSYRAYAATQLAVFEKYAGWFFWSYKTETNPAWSFKESIKRGWLPNNFFS